MEIPWYGGVFFSPRELRRWRRQCASFRSGLQAPAAGLAGLNPGCSRAVQPGGKQCYQPESLSSSHRRCHGEISGIALVPQNCRRNNLSLRRSDKHIGPGGLLPNQVEACSTDGRWIGGSLSYYLEIWPERGVGRAGGHSEVNKHSGG